MNKEKVKNTEGMLSDEECKEVSGGAGFFDQKGKIYNGCYNYHNGDFQSCSNKEYNTELQLAKKKKENSYCYQVLCPDGQVVKINCDSSDDMKESENKIGDCCVI